MKAKKFEELEIWQEECRLTQKIYSLTQTGVFAKDVDLKRQMRRSAVSITSNIAEGFERDTDKQFLFFLQLAKGSAGELRSQLYIALDEHYINKPTFDELYKLLTITGRKIGALMRYLKAKV